MRHDLNLIIGINRKSIYISKGILSISEGNINMQQVEASKSLEKTQMTPIKVTHCLVIGVWNRIIHYDPM